MLPKDDASWKPCAEGALASTIARVRSKRRQANLIRVGASSLTGTLMLVLASLYVAPKAMDGQSIDRECRQVGGLLAQYMSGDLAPDDRQLVEQHLANCEKCRIKMREMQGGDMETQSISALPSQAIKEELLLSAIQPMPFSVD